MASFNESRTFGVEIEFYGHVDYVVHELAARGISARFEGYHHRNEGRWKIVHDGSLGNSHRHGARGLELVSPPLAGQAGLEELRRACEALEAAGARVDVSCGVHVHHDVRDLGIVAWRNLFKLYAKYENAIDSVMPRSRRVSRWCKPLYYARGTAGLFDALDRCRTVRDIADLFNGNRYYKLNPTSYWRHGTVEFRQHSGSTDFEKISAWVILTSRMVDRAVRSSGVRLQGQGKFENVMKLCGIRSVTTFYRHRREHFAGRQQQAMAA